MVYKSSSGGSHARMRYPVWLAAALLSLVGTPARSVRSQPLVHIEVSAQAARPIRVINIGALKSGGRQAFVFALRRVDSLDLRVSFEEAPFNGTQLNAQINGRRLLPYFAFGGDTRYDNVKGKPGMRPPLPTIEGRWLISPTLLRTGRNEMILWTTGVWPDRVLQRIGPRPVIRINSLLLRRADGADLPVYANSLYYDFNVWPQGYDWGEDMERRHRYDLALLGVLNGKGMPDIIPPLGGSAASLWGVKRVCESNVLDWGIGHQEFYTIWEFAAKPQLWAKYVDVDKNPETRSTFHDQTLFESAVGSDPAARGADVALYDVEKYARSLEPAIRLLAPYTDFYNFKCEQHGPWGQGFNDDGERWASYGIHGDLWAGNFYQASKAAHDLVRKYNPSNGRVQEMNHWFPSIRHVLFDTALARKQPMSNMIDILMTHFGTLIPYDRDRDGNMIPGETFPLQYPGGRFDGEIGTWPDHLTALGYRPRGDALYPETAIDFNRYRLGRTAKDMKLADPTTHHWGNGQPFDYRAGLRGDELMYNSENGIWMGYSAPSPYQFLHGFFSYSLLPTGAGEPRDLKITTRQSVTQTTDVPVNLYGQWIEGAGHTKRLRTIDPLYGDMFGWTGDEHCNMGDFITMVGIKDPHHRRQPYDAYGLVRRTCYAFITSGPVVPASLGPQHAAELFVKAMAQVFEGKRYIGLYAANFDGNPHMLDVVLPVPLPHGAEALVFDDRAGDWKDAKTLHIAPGREVRYHQMIPALAAWLVLIPMPDGGLAQTLNLPAPPVPLSPVSDGAVSDAAPTFRWQADATANARYIVEVAREALFRARDRVEISSVLSATSYTLKASPQAAWRYFWRVRAINAQGRGGEWSPPRSFVYRWPEYSAAYPAQSALPATSAASTPAVAAPQPPWQRLADEYHLETAENLAWQGEIYGTGGNLHAPSRAVDGQAFSWWSNGANEDNTRFPLPAEWCILWPHLVKVSGVQILWAESLMPREFTVQISNDAQVWTDLLRTSTGNDRLTELKLDKPVETKYLRLYITAAASASGEVGVREVAVQ